MFKKIFELNEYDAELFFYKNESYYDGELPKYFHFTKMLWNIRNSYIKNRKNIKLTKAKYYENINYAIYTNKDGKYAWRKLQIINPVLYVDLVRYVTSTDNWTLIKERIGKLRKSCMERIICVSIPVSERKLNRNLKSSQILEWWDKMEQGSIKCAINYLYAYTTDISDCYPSIYTHSIAWAIHNKCIAKLNKNSNLLGNIIDKKIQSMQLGQTNGIPQGSILMTVIAEILLAYADRKLFFSLKRYGNIDYKIIRYRDDYKIFVNSKKDGELIIRELANVLLQLNLKLNSTKTRYYEDIILASIKGDKYNAIQEENMFLSKNIQKNLLRIHHFLDEFPCSKQMAKLMLLINDDIVRKIKEIPMKITLDQCEVLIGICTQIAYKNPSLYIYCCQILSTLLSVFTEKRAMEIIRMIFNKFSSCSHSSVMNIFLQRISLPYHISDDFCEKICKCVISEINGINAYLWNFDWIECPKCFMDIVLSQKFINKRKIENLKKVINRDEIDIFSNNVYN